MMMMRRLEWGQPPVGVNVMKNKLDNTTNYKFQSSSSLTLSLHQSPDSAVSQNNEWTASQGCTGLHSRQSRLCQCKSRTFEPQLCGLRCRAGVNRVDATKGHQNPRTRHIASLSPLVTQRFYKFHCTGPKELFRKTEDGHHGTRLSKCRTLSTTIFGHALFRDVVASVCRDAHCPDV